MCSVCEQIESRMAAGTVIGPGAVAQLVERHHGMVEVARSSRVSSTQLLPALLAAWDAIGFTLGGLVAAEGSFYTTQKLPPFVDGTSRKHFVFQVHMANRDRALIESLRAFLGFGSIHTRRPEQPQLATNKRAHSRLPKGASRGDDPVR